jgi:hypothetical protein
MPAKFSFFVAGPRVLVSLILKSREGSRPEFVIGILPWRLQGSSNNEVMNGRQDAKEGNEACTNFCTTDRVKLVKAGYSKVRKCPVSLALSTLPYPFRIAV